MWTLAHEFFYHSHKLRLRTFGSLQSDGRYQERVVANLLPVHQARLCSICSDTYLVAGNLVIYDASDHLSIDAGARVLVKQGNVFEGSDSGQESYSVSSAFYYLSRLMILESSAKQTSRRISFLESNTSAQKVFVEGSSGIIYLTALRL